MTSDLNKKLFKIYENYNVLVTKSCYNETNFYNVIYDLVKEMKERSINLIIFK